MFFLGGVEGFGDGDLFAGGAGEGDFFVGGAGDFDLDFDLDLLVLSDFPLAAVVLVVVLLVFVDVTFLVSGFEGADGLKSATMR